MSQPVTREIVGEHPGETVSTPPAVAAMPNPGRLFQVFNAYQQTAAMRAAIDLDIFTAIADRRSTAREIAQHAGAAERGIRILCDFLTVMGFLTKNDSQYALAPDAAMFLDRRSPAYMGSAARFLDAPEMLKAFDDLTSAVRKGGTMMGEEGTLSFENPIWVEFARTMAPMMMMPAEVISQLVEAPKGAPCRVLDIAAGHGLFGINIAGTIRKPKLWRSTGAAFWKWPKRTRERPGSSPVFHYRRKAFEALRQRLRFGAIDQFRTPLQPPNV